LVVGIEKEIKTADGMKINKHE